MAFWMFSLGIVIIENIVKFSVELIKLLWLEIRVVEMAVWNGQFHCGVIPSVGPIF